MRMIAAFCMGLLLGSPALAQSAEEAELVVAMFRSMNPQSITHDREVCGYIVENPSGRIEVGKASWGGNASCGTIPPPDGFRVLASWHTHAAWAAGYDNEVPSLIDVEGDMSLGINGWIATPGGRLWYVNGQTGEMHQYCGAQCLPFDPDAQMDTRGPVDKRYTLLQLRARFGQ